MIGTKSGDLELFDIASSSMVYSVAAHAGSIYSLHMRPDKRGFVTGGADKEAKFWDFKIDEEKVTKRKRYLNYLLFLYLIIN